jgi:hypothetical protein
MIQKFHPVSGSRAFGKLDPDGSVCPFDRDTIAWHGDLDPHALDFADEWLNDEELIEIVTLDGKIIIGAADRTLTADEVAAYARREWKGQRPAHRPGDEDQLRG